MRRVLGRSLRRLTAISRFGMSSSATEVVELSRRVPHVKDGRFFNPWPMPEFPKFMDWMKFMVGEKTIGTVEKAAFRGDYGNLSEIFRTQNCSEEDLKRMASPNPDQMQATWFGHSSVLIQFDGISVLTDPVSVDRCSPSQWFGPKRLVPFPVPKLERMPRVDICVISHNHYDHLCFATVKKLSELQPHLQFFVPLGVRQWFLDSGVANVTEMDWWEQKELDIPTAQESANGCNSQQKGNKTPDSASKATSATLETVRATVAFTPAQHTSNRGLFDIGKTLWGSWCIRGPRRNFFFAGDTGYCTAFQEIGRQYGPFDFSAIPVGAYDPARLMQMQHINPEEAVQIHKDVGSRKSLGVHWGTFVMTVEPITEPAEWLRRAVQKAGLPVDAFFVSPHGHTIEDVATSVIPAYPYLSAVESTSAASSSLEVGSGAVEGASSGSDARANPTPVLRPLATSASSMATSASSMAPS